MRFSPSRRRGMHRFGSSAIRLHVARGSTSSISEVSTPTIPRAALTWKTLDNEKIDPPIVEDNRRT